MSKVCVRLCFMPCYILQELSRKGVSSSTAKAAVQIIFGHNAGGIIMDEEHRKDYDSADESDETLQGT